MGKIVITGCPRSGTTFASRLFKFNGIQVGHEKFDQGGISSWTLAGRCNTSPCGPSWNAVVDRYGQVDVHHQVRHPLDVMASMFTLTEQSWQFAFKVIGQKYTTKRLYNAMVFWYEWNLRAAEMSVGTYRVEDIQDYFSLGQDYSNKKVNSRPHGEVTAAACRAADKQLFALIEDLATAYGFNI